MRVRTGFVVAISTGLGLTGLTAGGAGAATHTVSVRALDRSGDPVEVAATMLNLGNGRRVNLAPGATKAVADGTWLVSARVDDGGTSTIGTRAVSVSKDTTVTFDARAGRRISFGVDEPGAATAALMVMPRVTFPDDYVESAFADRLNLLPVDATYAIPMSHPRVRLSMHAVLTKKGATPSPYRFDIVKQLAGIPSTLSFRAPKASLARVDMTMRALDPGQVRWLNLNTEDDSGVGIVDESRGPSVAEGVTGGRLTSYRTGGLRWESEVLLIGANHGVALAVDGMTRNNRYLDYLAGKRYSEVWGAAGWGLPVRVSSDDRRVLSASVPGTLCPQPVDSQQQCEPYDYTASHVTPRLRLYSGGALLAEGRRINQTIPTTEKWYTLMLTAQRTGGTLAERALSKKITGTWRFRARGAADGTSPPAVGRVQFRPSGLDVANRAGRGTTTAVAVRVGGLPDVARMAVQYSYDGGRTWKSASAGRKAAEWVVRIASPGTAGAVSLRATAKSASGASVTYALINAYGVR